jgi:hypothetical protein
MHAETGIPEPEVLDYAGFVSVQQQSSPLGLVQVLSQHRGGVWHFWVQSFAAIGFCVELCHNPAGKHWKSYGDDVSW